MNEAIRNPEDAVVKMIALLHASANKLGETDARKSVTAYRSQLKTLEMVKNAGQAVLEHCKENAMQDHVEELTAALANANQALANADAAQRPMGALNFLRFTLGRK